MINGLIIDLNEKFATIVTEDGLFLKINLYGDMQEGQSVLITKEDLFMENQVNVKKTNNRLHTGILGVIAASLVIIAVSAIWFTSTYNTVYTAVMVDINPRIEIDLNKNNKVVKTVAHNDDALQLSLGELKGLSIEDALEMLVAEAGAKGFLKTGDDPYVLITTVAMKNQSLDALNQKIMVKFDDSSVLQKTNMAITSVTPEELELANENDVPAGLMSLLTGKTDTSVKSFFKDDSNVNQFEDKGVVIKGASVDATSSATSDVSSGNSNSSSDDSKEEMLSDLKERLAKLKTVANPSTAIKDFILKADAYLTTGVGDLTALTKDAKNLWDQIDDVDDDSDDDSDDSDDDSDDSDDDSDDSNDDSDDSNDDSDDSNDDSDDSNDDSDDSNDDSDDSNDDSDDSDDGSDDSDDDSDDSNDDSDDSDDDSDDSDDNSDDSDDDDDDSNDDDDDN